MNEIEVTPKDADLAGLSGLEKVLQKQLLPDLEAWAERNREIQRFIKLDGDFVFVPRRANLEHKQIAAISKTPWAGNIVRTRTDRCKVAGIRGTDGSDDEMWKIWVDAWGMTKKEPVINATTVTYGRAFVEMKKPKIGIPFPVVKSPFNFVAFFGNDGETDAMNSEFPVLAMERIKENTFKIWNDTYLSYWVKSSTGKYFLTGFEKHGFPVVPIATYFSDITADGESVGHIKPLIPLLSRISKAEEDSVLINHNNSWKVRTVTGLEPLNTVEQHAEETDEEYDRRLAEIEKRVRLDLGTDDLLVSSSAETVFGTLPETDPAGMVPYVESLLRQLSAVSATPAPYLTGESAPMSAEQSANDKDNFYSMINSLQDYLGVGHTTLIKLFGMATGREPEMKTKSIAWLDRDNGSIAAKVDALGKASQMLKIPNRELWKLFPNMTPEMYESWTKAADAIEATENAAMRMLAQMGNETRSPEEIALDEIEAGS